MGNVKKSLLTANKAHITDTQKTLCTINFTKIEKNVSAPSHHPNINKNKENEMILTEIGIEKKSFCMTRKIPLCSGWGFGCSAMGHI
jgi:hypothetical protein